MWAPGGIDAASAGANSDPNEIYEMKYRSEFRTAVFFLNIWFRYSLQPPSVCDGESKW